MAHKVQRPFMCRQGQFSEGSDLCVGIALSVLRSKKDHVVILGKKKYIFDCVNVLIRWETEQNKFLYKGNTVIVPIHLYCERIEDIQ